MRFFRFLLVGIFFGIVLVKSEAVSWYRIYEMFKFQSFHMFGIIGTAVTLGIVLLFFLRKRRIKSIEGDEINLKGKEKTFYRYLLGGSIFGAGWALAGACPGPMYVLVGTGTFSMLIVILAALAGTLLYGALKNYLPH